MIIKPPLPQRATHARTPDMAADVHVWQGSIAVHAEVWCVGNGPIKNPITGSNGTSQIRRLYMHFRNTTAADFSCLLEESKRVHPISQNLLLWPDRSLHDGIVWISHDSDVT